MAEPSMPMMVKIYSLKGRANFIEIVFAIHMIISGIIILSDYWQYSMLQEIANGGYVDEYTIEENDNRQALMAVLRMFFMIVTAVAFIMWFFRAYKNLRLANVAGLKYSPGWTIGAFFIPIGNLFIPYNIMEEVWKGSHVLSGEVARDGWKNKKLNFKVPIWWVSFMIYYLGGYFLSRMYESSSSVDGMIYGTLISMAVNLCSILAAVLGILIVDEITDNQHRVIGRLGT